MPPEEVEETNEETNGVQEITRGGIISARDGEVGVPEDERAKILEEVRKLQQSATQEHPDVPKPAKKKAAPPPEPEPQADEEEETELSKLLKEREAKATQKLPPQPPQDDWAKRVQDLARVEAETLTKKQQLEQELARVELLKRDPAAGLRALGVDPMEWAQRLAGTVKPDNPELASLKSELTHMRELIGSVQKKSTELDEYKSAVQQQLMEFQLQKENENLIKALEAEKADKEVKYAYLGDTDAIVKRARTLAGLYIESTGKKTCEYPLLVKQLKAEANKKLAELAKDDEFYEMLTSLRQKAAGGKGQGGPGKKPAASPSARAGSERRATPKPVEDMDSDEQVELMRQAARDAVKGMGKPA